MNHTSSNRCCGHCRGSSRDGQSTASDRRAGTRWSPPPPWPRAGWSARRSSSSSRTMLARRAPVAGSAPDASCCGAARLTRRLAGRHGPPRSAGDLSHAMRFGSHPAGAHSPHGHRCYAPAGLAVGGRRAGAAVLRRHQRRRHPAAGVDQRRRRPDRAAVQRSRHQPVRLARPARPRLRRAGDLLEPPRHRRLRRVRRTPRPSASRPSSTTRSRCSTTPGSMPAC